MGLTLRLEKNGDYHKGIYPLRGQWPLIWSPVVDGSKLDVTVCGVAEILLSIMASCPLQW